MKSNCFMQTDGQTDVTKLTVAFLSFAETSKNHPSARLYHHDSHTIATRRFATSGKALPVQHNTPQHTQRTQNSGNHEYTELIHTKQNAISRFIHLKKKYDMGTKWPLWWNGRDCTDAKDLGSSVVWLFDARFYMIIYGYRFMRYQAWSWSWSFSSSFYSYTFVANVESKVKEFHTSPVYIFHATCLQMTVIVEACNHNKFNKNILVLTDSLWYLYACDCRSQWLRGLRYRSAAACLMRLLVRIPSEAWMSVSWECCVLSVGGLCDELIIRTGKTYRLWWVVCDLESSWMRSP